MTELIFAQIKGVLVMIAAGIGMGMIFDSLGFVSKKMNNKKIENLLYLFSWLISAELFSEFLYRSSYGKLSLYGLVSAVLGILLWKKTIYAIMFVGCKYGKTKDKRE